MRTVAHFNCLVGSQARLASQYRPPYSGRDISKARRALRRNFVSFTITPFELSVHSFPVSQTSALPGSVHWNTTLFNPSPYAAVPLAPGSSPTTTLVQSNFLAATSHQLSSALLLPRFRFICESSRDLALPGWSPACNSVLIYKADNTNHQHNDCQRERIQQHGPWSVRHNRCPQAPATTEIRTFTVLIPTAQCSFLRAFYSQSEANRWCSVGNRGMTSCAS